MDYAKIAIAELANIAERRVEHMLDPAVSGLPAFLARQGGVQLALSAIAFGFAVSGMHYTAMAGLHLEPLASGSHQHAGGLTASPQEAQEVHAAIRAQLAAESAEVARGVRILYGGSVKAANAVELFGMQDIDGGLIGGASLNADEFGAICRAAGNR